MQSADASCGVRSGRGMVGEAARSSAQNLTFNYTVNLACIRTERAIASQELHFRM